MKTGHYLSLNSRGLHRLHYTEWGMPNACPLICVHGLSRNGRDFDTLATALSQEGYWVICPDMAGRGHSDWLVNAKDYCLEQYLHDALALIARLGVEQVDWLGSSIGGLMGIALAGFASSPVKRLILNDIGPDIASAGIKHLQCAAPNVFDFNSLDLAERYFRQTLSGIGNLDTGQWRHLTKCSIKPTHTGGYTLRCDPKIYAADLNTTDPQRLWQAWQQLRCHTLTLRGELSDVLTPESLVKMQQQQRRCSVHEILGAGHTPFLADPESIDTIRQWLKASPHHA